MKPTPSQRPARLTPTLTLTLTLCAALALSASACNPYPNASVGDEPGSPVNANGDEMWPGGSLDGWTREGSVESFERSDSPSTDYSGGDFEAGAPWDDYEGAAAGAAAGASYSSEAPYPEPGYEEPPYEPSPADPSEPSSDLTADAPRQEPALEGGEIDDNDDLSSFIAYMEGERALYGYDPSVQWLDVSERHIITVTDSLGVTAPDARLVFSDEEGRVLQIGRTRADGRFAFFPRVVGAEGAVEVVAQTAYGSSAPALIEVAAQGAEQGAVVEADLRVTLRGQRPVSQDLNLEVAFVVDATGSMGGEIERLKDTVTSIAARVGQDGVRLRLGAVSYRDRGDDYTTRAYNFTERVDAFQGVINSLEAGGGGDYPEALNEALEETQRRLAWTREESLRLTFLITDAPAHHYEQQPFTYANAVLDAQQMGMKIFPIASGGSDGVAELQLRQIAQHTLAHFIFVTEGGGSPAGSEGSDYHVDPAQFAVERLDDLVVRLINDEIAAWRARPVSL